MSVYNVFVLCTIGAPLSLAVREKPDASFSIVSTCIIVCTSITLCLVFIPKVSVMFCWYTLEHSSQAIWKDIEVEFEKSLLLRGETIPISFFNYTKEIIYQSTEVFSKIRTTDIQLNLTKEQILLPSSYLSILFFLLASISSWDFGSEKRIVFADSDFII